MNDEFDREEEPEQPEALVTTEQVDRDSYVAVIHDSFGEHYVNVALMRERAPTVSVLRILGAMNLEPKCEPCPNPPCHFERKRESLNP